MPPKPAYDRDALIKRARDLFWSKGWAGTSMKDLQDELDLRPGSFYAAFGSKDALYALTLDRYGEDAANLLAELEDAHGPLGALRANMMAFADPTSRPAAACYLVRSLSELGSRATPLAEQAGALLDQAEGRFADLFTRARDAGEIAPGHDPRRLARRYQAQLTGLRAAAGRNPADAAELARDFVADLDALA